MNKILSIILAVALIAGVFWIVQPLTPAYAEEYRNGFRLAPIHYDATGIYTDTGFILKSDKDYTVDQIRSMLVLTGENPIQITGMKKNEFQITPEKEFETNRLYSFVLTTAGKETASWTFQTRRGFAVLGTLPANQSSYVPINSGIEIYLSHVDFANLESFFEISPKTEGRFERNGYTMVFIPKKLEPATLYTLTVKAGLPLKGTNQKLAQDYVFQFETEPEASDRTESKGTLYFNNTMMEFSTDKAPLIPLNVYAGKNKVTQAVVKTTLYRYKNSGAFIEAIRKKQEQPDWAYSIQEKNVLAKDGLQQVSSFEQTFDLTQWQQKYLSVPEALPKGFYLIESTFNGLTAQALVQSTNLSAYLTESDTRTLVWVNHLKDQKPEASAQVTLSGENKSYTSDASGVASFDTLQRAPDRDGNYKLEYYLIRSRDEELVLIQNRYRIYEYNAIDQNDYWRYLQTDRNLYKPDDMVQFWGFLENRYDGTAPSALTIEIAEGRYWGIPGAKILGYFLPSLQKPLITLTVPVENGFFEGDFQLPELSPGGYQVILKIGDTVINSHYINVENYVKPAYKMTVEKDRNAIFLGECVNFTIIPSFFDGTALPFLDVSYNLGGYPFAEGSATAATGANGKLSVPFTAKTVDSTAQGEQYMFLNANASLPESGMINGNNSVRVFINDIHAAFETSADKEGNITLKAIVNEVDLEKLNHPASENPTPWTTPLGDPVPNKNLGGTLIYHTWEKIEVGEEYDYINKTVSKRYRYDERTEDIRNFSFRTDEKGMGVETFTLKNPNEGYYTAEVVWQDGNGRVMHSNVYLSNRQAVNYPQDQHDWYHLEAGKEKYRTGDPVTVTLKNNEETVSEGSFLFVESQRGITHYEVLDSAAYKTRFTAEKIPNFYVNAVYFTGKGYIAASSQNIPYDTDERKIEIQMEADKEAYRPGDTVILKITAQDESGKPVAAKVNLAMIDEAMLELSNIHTDVLGSLYQWLNSGLRYSYASHGTDSSNLYGSRDVTFTSDSKMMTSAVMAESPVQEGANGLADNNMGSVRVRSEFKDTALFHLAALSEDGTGTVSFKLPDNVTSWHVTLAGISPDLHGGTGEASLKVTLPFFISDSLNTTYLSGDFPYIGVSSYGNDLKEGETIQWQVTSPQIPGYLQTASGKAFERSNIALWQLEAGVYDIEIKAVSESGLSDGIKRTIHVMDTYHEIEKAVSKKLEANMTLTGGEDGLTTLFFTDEGRGRLVPILYNLLYSGGSRLDQKFTACRADALLDKIVSGRKSLRDVSEVDLSQYQKADGGFGILPYSESDAELSALLSSLLKDEAGAVLLKQYFYSMVFEEPGRVNAPALYALAEMGEAVLVDLNKALQVQNLELKDTLYLALAFDALGETTVAQTLYSEKIVPLLENQNPYIRVKSSDEPDEILKNTALAAVLASRLDSPDKDGLFRYINAHDSTKLLIHAEKLLVILEEYEKLSATDVEFTYDYDGKTYTEALKNGGGITVKIPSIRLSGVKIKKVSGEASVVSVFDAPLTEKIQPDENLSITRTCYDYRTGRETTEFKQNDIVKVVLDYDIAATAMDSFYEITDYAPSGLKPIESPYQAGIRPEGGSICWSFRNTDGQKVTFNVYRDLTTRQAVYYARVVSPGTFKADSTIIQGTLVKDSMKLSESTSIKIAE